MYPVFCRFYYRNDREQNWPFTEMCEALIKFIKVLWVKVGQFSQLAENANFDNGGTSIIRSILQLLKY